MHLNELKVKKPQGPSEVGELLSNEDGTRIKKTRYIFFCA